MKTAGKPGCFSKVLKKRTLISRIKRLQSRLISLFEYDIVFELNYEEVESMSLALKIILLIASIILTISILLQSSNSAGLSGSIGGGAEQLFGKKRSSGYDAILSKISTVTAILFIVLSLILVAIE